MLARGGGMRRARRVELPRRLGVVFRLRSVVDVIAFHGPVPRFSRGGSVLLAGSDALQSSTGLGRAQGVPCHPQRSAKRQRAPMFVLRTQGIAKEIGART